MLFHILLSSSTSVADARVESEQAIWFAGYMKRPHPADGTYMEPGVDNYCGEEWGCTGATSMNQTY